jgi:alkanesulfonate monooxygenase SsuD/methylene tetrahydromethanopterin reductase-like flavin-dependent oxidoreductase (luciferase family)
MTCETFRDDMLDVLYGEAAPEAERRFAEHHDHCQACRQELRDLRGVRRELGGWRVPAPMPLQFPGSRPAPPAWLLMAATVVLSAGASLLVTRTQLAAAPRAEATPVARLLAAQEQRHQKEIAEIRAALSQRPVATIDENAVLQRAQELVRASETRQGLVLQARLTDLTARTEAQRRYDLAQMSAGLTYLDGKTGLQAARTTELVGHILQASAKR